MKSLVAVGWLLVSSGNAAAAEAIWPGFNYGPWCVGTASIKVIDQGRPAPMAESNVAPQRGRAIAGRVWYPSACRGSPLPFWRYWAEARQSAASELLKSIRELHGSEAAAQIALSKAFDLTVRAQGGGAARKTRVPLVLIPGSAGTQSLLAEFLASYNLVAATVEYQGTFVPDYAAGLPDLESQVQDLQRVVAALAERSDVDATHLGLVCHAISSSACALLAMRDPRIAALASWEGGLPSRFEQDLIRRSAYFDVAAFRSPLLVLHAPHPNIDPAQLDAYRFAVQLRIQLPQTTEHHLLSYGALESLAPGILGEARPRAHETLLLAAETLQRFLQVTLHGEDLARESVTAPSKAADLLTDWQWRPAHAARVTLSDLQRLVRTRGVAGLRAYCVEVGCAEIADPEVLRRLGGWLSFQEPALAEQRLDLAQLRVELFPASARAHAALALAAHDRGDWALFDRESTAALARLVTDPDTNFDAAARENLRAELERRRAARPTGQ